MKVVDFYKLIGNRERLIILLLIARYGSLCVCELVHALQVSQPLISRHLSRMRQLNILTSEQRGVWKYYKLAQDLPGWQKQILEISAVQKDSILVQICERLDDLKQNATDNNPCPN